MSRFHYDAERGLIVPRERRIERIHTLDAASQQALLVGGGGPATDPYFANVALLLHGDGANGGTTITDSSSHARTGTRLNVTTSTAVSPKYGTASLLCSAGWMQYADSADFTLGTGDFTLEGWLYGPGSGTAYWVAGQSDSGGSTTSLSIAIQHTAGLKIRGFCGSGASAIGDCASTTSTATNTWAHFAYVRSGSGFTMYFNGVSQGTASSASSVNNSPNAWSVGALGEVTSNRLNTHMDDFRFTVGVARYTANFTPPTAAFPNS